VKKEIHPTWYPEARVTCACGNSWVTGATVPEIRTDVCSACHPFYTGEQRIVDTEGQVDRFMRRLRARDDILTIEEIREQSQAVTSQPISILELGSRYENILIEAGFETLGDILESLDEKGDAELLDVKGIGRKSLIDIKKGLRALGFEVAETQA